MEIFVAGTVSAVFFSLDGMSSYDETEINSDTV